MDQLANARLLRGLSDRLTTALDFLADADVQRLPLGRTSIKGDDLFALVQEYDTRPVSECRWESHQRYCDVQFVATGSERIGVSQFARVRLVTPYDDERDVAFYDGEGDLVTLSAGMFMILWPHDVHMPCVATDKSVRVRKVVIKARIDEAL